MARRSKRSSNRAKRLAKIDQDSRPKIVPLKLDAKALSRMVAGRGTILPNLNMQDNLIIQKLATAKACIQLGGVCQGTEQNQTRNTVL